MATLIILPTGINQYGTTTGALPSIETTIVSYVVPATKIFYIVGASGNGTAKGYFRLKVNGATQAQREMDVSDRNVEFDFSDMWGLKTVAGDVVTITIVNTSSVSGDYTANLHGGFQ